MGSKELNVMIMQVKKWSWRAQMVQKEARKMEKGETGTKSVPELIQIPTRPLDPLQYCQSAFQKFANWPCLQEDSAAPNIFKKSQNDTRH